MNGQALKKVKMKHQSYRRFLNSQEGQAYQEYLQQRNAAQKAVRKAKRDFENQIAAECKKNPKAFWSYYKDRTSRYRH